MAQLRLDLLPYQDAPYPLFIRVRNWRVAKGKAFTQLLGRVVSVLKNRLVMGRSYSQELTADRPDDATPGLGAVGGGAAAAGTTTR